MQNTRNETLYILNTDISMVYAIVGKEGLYFKSWVEKNMRYIRQLSIGLQHV